jgi:hypothetical protein
MRMRSIPSRLIAAPDGQALPAALSELYSRRFDRIWRATFSQS